MATMEYKHFTIPIDVNVQREIEVLLQQGWTPVPGVMPVAVYHLQRAVNTDMAGVQVNVGVDDNGVMIVRNGKLIHGN